MDEVRGKRRGHHGIQNSQCIVTMAVAANDSDSECPMVLFDGSFW
jgi:hypothetical protein